MSAHDFRRLSGLDFEELVHDLLAAAWRCKLEAFSAGLTFAWQLWFEE